MNFTTAFTYHGCTEYEDNRGSGHMARVETSEEQIPVNIFMEPESDFSLREGDPCETDVYGVSRDLKAYPTEEAYYNTSENKLAAKALIPSGTFPFDPEANDTFKQSPWIIFSGKVLYAEKNPEPDGKAPDYFLAVETFDMTLLVYAACKDEIEEDYIVSGTAWIFGVLKKPGQGSDFNYNIYWPGKTQRD